MFAATANRAGMIAAINGFILEERKSGVIGSGAGFDLSVPAPGTTEASRMLGLLAHTHPADRENILAETSLLEAVYREVRTRIDLRAFRKSTEIQDPLQQLGFESWS